jgi:four helix bundle protein
MATVDRFEDLVAFKKARALTQDVYRAFADCPDDGFCDQIQRASISIMSNIAEGFESGTQDKMLNYLYIAKGSAGEVRAQLYAAKDVGYVKEEEFKDLKGQAEECSRLIYSFIKKVKAGGEDGLQRKDESETTAYPQVEMLYESDRVRRKNGTVVSFDTWRDKNEENEWQLHKDFKAYLEEKDLNI